MASNMLGTKEDPIFVGDGDYVHDGDDDLTWHQSARPKKRCYIQIISDSDGEEEHQSKAPHPPKRRSRLDLEPPSSRRNTSLGSLKGSQPQEPIILSDDEIAGSSSARAPRYRDLALRSLAKMKHPIVTSAPLPLNRERLQGNHSLASQTAIIPMEKMPKHDSSHGGSSSALIGDTAQTTLTNPTNRFEARFSMNNAGKHSAQSYASPELHIGEQEVPDGSSTNFLDEILLSLRSSSIDCPRRQSITPELQSNIQPDKNYRQTASKPEAIQVEAGGKGVNANRSAAKEPVLSPSPGKLELVHKAAIKSALSDPRSMTHRRARPPSKAEPDRHAQVVQEESRLDGEFEDQFNTSGSAQSVIDPDRFRQQCRPSPMQSRLSSVEDPIEQFSDTSMGTPRANRSRKVGSGPGKSIAIAARIEIETIPPRPASKIRTPSRGRSDNSPHISNSPAGNKDEDQTRINACLRKHLAARYEDHAYMTQNALWRQRSCFEREKNPRYFKYQRGTSPDDRGKFVQKSSPFSSMPAINVPWHQREKRSAVQAMTRGKTTWAIQTIRQPHIENFVQPFKEYVPIQQSILADNDSRMARMPDVGEIEKKEENRFEKNLPRRYEVKSLVNLLSDVRDEQCRFYNVALESFFAEIGVSWPTILFWLLAMETTLTRIAHQSRASVYIEAVIKDRSEYSRDTQHPIIKHGRKKLPNPCLFERSAAPWLQLLEELKEPTMSELHIAAIACKAVLKECGLSIWYFAQQSEPVRKFIKESTKSAQRPSKFTYRAIMCRVCYQHNCLLHGELRQDPQDPLHLVKDTVANKDHGLSTDSEVRKVRDPTAPTHFDFESSRTEHGTDDEDPDIVEDFELPRHIEEHDANLDKAINYKTIVKPEKLQIEKAPKKKHPIPPPGVFDERFWRFKTLTYKWDDRNPFFPCSHDGACSTARCRCYLEGITCEKTCDCSPDCARRFPGCDCGTREDDCKCEQGSDNCLCIVFNRECDPDLCGSCGAREILNPINRRNEKILRGRCSNVSIQRGIPKKTLLGKSELHGFGVYAGQDIKRGEWIGEYTGELISHGEVHRRNLIYEHRDTMYTFMVNKAQDVDGMHMGNKLRFVNNAPEELANCGSQVRLCNTVLRIGLYAKVDIAMGKELFFPYGYQEHITEAFKVPKNVAVAVKEAAQKASVRKATAANRKGKKNSVKDTETVRSTASAWSEEHSADDESHEAVRSKEVQNSQQPSAFESQKTDDEDDEFRLEDGEEDKEVESTPEESEGEGLERPLRGRQSRSAPAVTVRTARRKTRSATGRKQGR